MQITLESILVKKSLIGSLIACTTIILILNLIDRDATILVGNLTYIPVAGSLLALSLLILARFGTIGHHGVAWFSFAGYAVSMFIAEMLWIIQELYLKIDPFPSAADIFYLIGYPFLLMFYVEYFQPVRNAITKKMFFSAFAFSIGILIPSLYITLGSMYDTQIFEVILGAIYPIFDAMILIPALIGVSLFFKGQVNLMWTLFCLGTISVFVADAAFLFGQNEDSYYTGNPMEIPYYWNYILLSFGVYSHILLFHKTNSDKKLEDLR
jgi:hypothetical protein